MPCRFTLIATSWVSMRLSATVAVTTPASAEGSVGVIQVSATPTMIAARRSGWVDQPHCDRRSQPG
jgi:hypothetical protein